MMRTSGTVRALAVVVGALLALVAGWQLIDAGSTLRDVSTRAQAGLHGTSDEVRGEITTERRLFGVELETVAVPVGDGATAVEVLGGSDAGPGDTVVLAVVNPDLPGVSGTARIGADTSMHEVSTPAMTATVGGTGLVVVGLLGLFALVGMRPATGHRGPVHVSPGPYW